MRHRRADHDAGFTLVELAVAMVLFGIIVAIGVAPYTRYHRTQQQIGLTRRIVATLRSAQVSAVSENTRYRVDFTPSSLTVYRAVGTTGWVKTATVVDDVKAIEIQSPQFQLPDGTMSSSCYFYPRGNASKTPLNTGIAVTRTDSAKKYTVRVEGLTARVSYK